MTQAFASPAHGGIHDAELQALGLAARGLVDFSVNINPYGPHPAVLRAVRRAGLATYPDPTARGTRQVLGEHLGVEPSRLALGHGAATLLWHGARLLAARGPALVVEPTFSEYQSALRAAGASTATWWADATRGFALDLPAIAEAAHACGATSVWLCSPNNPTGVRVPAATLASWAATHPWTLVLDQSFVSLSTHPEDAAVPMPDNVICLRSLTKDHALAGLRVGYLLAAPAFVSQFERTRAPWSCGTLAQVAIRAACAHPEFVARTRRRLLRDGAALRRLLATRCGLVAAPSAVPFSLVPVRRATEIRHTLLRHWNILVRDCETFGLPDTLRLAARPKPDRLALCRALEAVLYDASP